MSDSLITLCFRSERGKPFCNCRFCKLIIRTVVKSHSISELIKICPRETPITFSDVVKVVEAAQDLNTKLQRLTLKELCLEAFVNFFPKLLAKDIARLEIPLNLKKDISNCNKFYSIDYAEYAYLSTFVVLMRHHVGQFIVII